MMKLQDLKATVYKLADVNTTKQLKAKYEEIRVLDMRQKASWEKAFTIIQSPQSQPSQSKFEHWRANPPDEYKDLFAEIEAASQLYDQKSLETKRLARETLAIATNLEDLAEDYQQEADQLEQEVKTAKRISEQARLN